MLTKEECENALDNILCNIGVARSDYRTSGKAREDYHTLKSLIEEHFDNPPLKFEQIEICKWYWDNKICDWIKIELIIEDKKLLCCDGFHRRFEENRFYRKEVQE